MKIVFSGNAIWQLVSQSDTMTWMVYIILLLMSIGCWTIFLYKLVSWRIWNRSIKVALAHIKAADSIEDLVQISSKLSNTIPGYFLSRSLAQTKQLTGPNRKQLSDQKYDYLRDMQDQLIDSIVQQERSYLSFLSVSASIAPLLGLYGTIWGLIHAFIDISKKQAADITVVAPGVAEALMATLESLIIALPALAMYHYLFNRVIKIEQQLMTLSDYFLGVMQRLYWSHDTHENGE
ncbi:MAG TPA: MotA/TolQ/ExbB proton channel family protein [Candidatus Babeliales bacterium]|nr:MotA/TolQ/ExbB proton channel family protein [Candidatus Babeliales bacterium]